MDGMDHNKQQVEIDVMRSATHPQTNHNQSKHGNEKRANQQSSKPVKIG